MDFDQRKPPSLRPIWAVLHRLGMRAEWTRIDMTAKGWHVVIRLNVRLPLFATIAIQACLGSDKRREILNMRRALALAVSPSKFWLKRANILYEEKVVKK